MGDNIAEVQGPQAPVYQLQHQGDFEFTAIKTELQKIWKTLQSPSQVREQPQSRSQPDICWYHERFAALQVSKATLTGKLDCQSVNAAHETDPSLLFRLYDEY